MGDRSEGRTLPEEVGMNIIMSSLIGMTATTIIYVIMLFFIASASLRSESLVLKVLVSVVLTTIIPTILYKYGRKAIISLIDDLLMSRMAVRGKLTVEWYLLVYFLLLLEEGCFSFHPYYWNQHLTSTPSM